MFQTMDTDNSGAITYDELKEGLIRYGSTLKDTEIRDLMEAVSWLKPSGLLVYKFSFKDLESNVSKPQTHPREMLSLLSYISFKWIFSQKKKSFKWIETQAAYCQLIILFMSTSKYPNSVSIKKYLNSESKSVTYCTSNVYKASFH
jgi:hypothetical protein